MTFSILLNLHSEENFDHMNESTAKPSTLSPVTIVHEARKLIVRGLAGEAYSLLESVHASAEYYPSFYVALGECLIALGRQQEAQTALKRALVLAPNSARPAILLESLYLELPRTQEMPSNKSSVMGRASSDKKTSGAKTLASLFGEHDEATLPRPRMESKVDGILDTPKTPSFDLAHVASMLTRDRPLVRPTSDTHLFTGEHHEESHEPPLVSETLAGILLGQGKLNEALSAYKQLKRVNPDRAKEYDERIRSIESRVHH